MCVADLHRDLTSDNRALIGQRGASARIQIFTIQECVVDKAVLHRAKQAVAMPVLERRGRDLKTESRKPRLLFSAATRMRNSSAARPRVFRYSAAQYPAQVASEASRNSGDDMPSSRLPFSGA